MFSSISLSRWKRTSSSSSTSILDLKKSDRNRDFSLLSMAISFHSECLQNQFHRPGELSPRLSLGRHAGKSSVPCSISVCVFFICPLDSRQSGGYLTFCRLSTGKDGLMELEYKNQSRIYAKT